MFRRFSLRAVAPPTTQYRAISGYMLFNQQIMKTNKFPEVKKQVNQAGTSFGQRSKIIATAWEKVSASVKKDLGKLGSKIPTQSKKNKWLTKHDGDKTFKSFNGQAKVKVMDKYRLKLKAAKKAHGAKFSNWFNGGQKAEKFKNVQGAAQVKQMVSHWVKKSENVKATVAKAKKKVSKK